MPNLKHAPELIVPDGCSAGIALRIVVVLNLAALIIALAAGWRLSLTDLTELATTALWLEPAVLASLVCWCLARRLVAVRAGLQAAWLQWGIALIIPVFICAQYWWILDELLNMTGLFTPGRLLAVLGVCAALVYSLQLREKVLSPALQTARLQALQTRIRPHFLFNSLNAVLAVIRTEPRTAETMLEDLAELFRALLQDPRQLVLLDQEITLCKQYIAIEQMRLGERLQMQWELDPQVNVMATKVPPLLLQPLIENAVMHGVELIPTGGLIRVEVTSARGALSLRVSNPVLPTHAAKVAAGTAKHTGSGHHVALQNIQERLSLLYDLSARMNIMATNGQFEVHITLPLQSRT